MDENKRDRSLIVFTFIFFFCAAVFASGPKAENTDHPSQDSRVEAGESEETGQINLSENTALDLAIPLEGSEPTLMTSPAGPIGPPTQNPCEYATPPSTCPATVCPSNLQGWSNIWGFCDKHDTGAHECCRLWCNKTTLQFCTDVNSCAFQ